MSRWLAIDTATDLASVALGAPSAGTRPVARTAAGARRHAANIVQLIREVLDVGHATPRDIAGIVVGDGPGSFTGLRIAWAAAKGLAHERDVPLRAIPTLMAAAHAAAQGDAPVAACFDALRGQVYGALYAFPARGVTTLIAPALFTIPELAAAAPVPPVLAVGDGALRYAPVVAEWTGQAPRGLDTLPPLAISLLDLQGRPGAERPLEDPRGAEPVYGRPAEAQAKWEARHGRPLSPRLPHTAR